MTLRTEQSRCWGSADRPRHHRRNQPLPVLRVHAPHRSGVSRNFDGHELLPPELKPEDEWVLFGYDGVFQAFRDDKVFTSAAYDKTIGLVMGHTILAMERQGASRPSQPGGQGLPRHRARAMGTVGHRAGLRPAGRRDQGRRARRPGEGVDVRVPHPDHLRTARASPRRPRHVPATVARPHLDPDRHRGGVDRGGRVAQLLPRPGRAAPPQADQRHHRRPVHRGDRRREARPTRRSSRSCGCCCPPGWRPPTGRRATCSICC